MITTSSKIFIYFVQSISPGLVRTEFLGRLRKVDDIEESKKSYGTVGVRMYID